MIWINIALIAFLCVFIIDFSGIIDSMDSALQKWLKNPLLHIPKPFSCSLCMTWWTGILYVLLSGQISLVYVAYTGLVAALTPVILRLLHLLRDSLAKILELLERLFHI